MTLVGASAGTFAVVMAVFANTLLNWNETSVKFRLLRLSIVGAFVVTDIVTVILQPKISFVAHFGGGLIGILLGLVILKNWEIKSFEVKVQMVCLCLFVITVIVTFILMIVTDHTQL